MRQKGDPYIEEHGQSQRPLERFVARPPLYQQSNTKFEFLVLRKRGHWHDRMN